MEIFSETSNGSKGKSGSPESIGSEGGSHLSGVKSEDEKNAIKEEPKSDPLSIEESDQNCPIIKNELSAESKSSIKKDSSNALLLPSLPPTSSVTITKAANGSNSSHSNLQSLISTPVLTTTSSGLTCGSILTSFSSCSSSVTITAAPQTSNCPNTLPTSSGFGNISLQSHSAKAAVPLDMMPTIPLVPVQVPGGRGGIITLTSKSRGRPKSFSSHFMPQRQSIGMATRKGVKVKRLGSGLVRGGRRLVHSMSLDDKGVIGLRDDATFNTEEEIQYSQDDMFVVPPVQEKWPGKNCAFCCLNELSHLGQGELNRYDATPGFNLPEKAQFTEDVLREASASKRFKSSHGPFKDKGKSPRKHVCDNLSDPVEEMAAIGHLERPNLAVLFTTNGQCFAHYMCALWSHGVELASDDSIACVDKAVVVASERKCSSCQRLGASIPCRVNECPSWYHFPCAMSVGAVMDLKSVAMVCPSHADKAKEHLVDLACMACDQSSNVKSLLFCSLCGNHYHGHCLKPPLSVSSVVRHGWHCPDCKICQVCRQPGDDVLCMVCDKAYHTLCARPQCLAHSRNDWKCKNCRVCGDCGSRTPGNGLSSRWHSNFTVCDSCYQLRNKGLACPICKKAYRAIMQKGMAQCSICRKHVHSHCDGEADLNVIHSKWMNDRTYEFTCSVCRVNPSGRLQSGSVSSHSPDREDSQESLPSEDSNDADMLDESSSSPVKPLSSGLSSHHSPLSASTTSCTPTTTTSVGLSSFSNLQSSFDRPSTGTSTSSFSRGKPFGLARRGSILFPRMRGAVNKFNLGKKGGVTSGRKRGSSTIPTGRKGRGNSSMQGGRGYRGYFNYQPVTLQASDSSQGTGKEEGEENKIILISASDKFSLWQDICAMCGAFGQDQEGRLIACSQCGQCFHPYCANVKVNKVVLEKGWRCLDCTVCEGCGERNDEARLVLCEDCDISCHIYCMTPPLDQVPAGIWKCKWCAVCQYCGATDPGSNSMWQQNYSMCGPCFSMTTCPVCDEPYADSELIIQCSSCDRWLHASDDMIHTEDEAEKCIEKGYLCLMCRTPESLPPHLLPASPPRVSSNKTGGGKGTNNASGPNISLSSSGLAMTSAHTVTSPTRSESPIDFMSKGNSNAQHWMDGTCLSDSGYHQIQNMTLQPMKKPRNLKGIRSRPSLDSTGSRDLDDDDDDDEDKLESSGGVVATPQHWVYGMKEGTVLNAREHGDPPNLPEGYYTLPGLDHGTFILRKRRYRNIKTVGIGGFQVRARAKKDEEKAREEAEMDPQQLELRRKRSKWRTKKKIRLLEKFPSYIQEAFFGRNLMDTSNFEEDKKQIEEFEAEPPPEDNIKARKIGPSIRLSQDELELISAAKEKHEQSKQRKSSGFSLPPEQQPQPKVLNMKLVGTGTTGAAGRPNTQKEMIPLPQHQQGHQMHSSAARTVEEKKPKEEKVDDIVEDDENNDAIEALFGAGGSALISDDLVRDIMNDDIKDEDAGFTETEDRDQIDGDSSVDGGKFVTDLLGPGFNLEDVADIMKNLREENSEDLPQSLPDNNPVCVSRVITAPRNVISTSTAVTPSGAVLHQQQQQIQAAVSVMPQSISFQNSQRPNQPMMAPLGTAISGLSHPSTGGLPDKVTSITLQHGNIPSQGGVSVHQNQSSMQSTFSSEAPPHQQQVVISRPDYTNHGSIVAPGNINSFHPSPNLAKPVGTVITHHGLMQQVKGIPNISNISSGVLGNLPPKLPLQSISTAITNSNPSISNPPVASVVVQQIASSVPHGVISHTQAISVNSSGPLMQQSGSYPHFAGGNEPPPPQPSSQLSTSLPTSEIPKSWTSSTSENQSLSLTLEEDEALGSKATKAAVLYANIHNPSLRTEVALIQDRERQIKRMWKALDAEQRKYYAQKARENKKEYFKNKQEYQRALKSQEKESAAGSGIISQEIKQSDSQGSMRASTSQSHIKSGGVNMLHRGQAIRYQPGLNIVHSRLSNQNPSQNEGTLSLDSSMQRPHNASEIPSPQQNVRYHHPSSNEGMNIQLPVSPHSGVTSPSVSQIPKSESFRSPEEGAPPLSSDSFSLSSSSPYTNPPSTPRPHDEANFLPQHSPQGQVIRQDGLSEAIQHKQIMQQQKWDDGISPPQNIASPTRFEGQFRQPLPPLGPGQQVRMRLPGHPALISQSNVGAQQLDSRMRIIIQQQQQQRLQQQQQQQQQQHMQHQQQTLYHQQQNLQEPQRQQLQQNSLELPHSQQQQQILGLRTQKLEQHEQQRLTNHPHQQREQQMQQLELTQQQQLDKHQQHADKSQHVSELPESVTRELEQLEKEHKKKGGKISASNDVEMESGSDLSQMEDDLLSGIGDFKDLLDYADLNASERDPMPEANDSKLPANLFDNLDDDGQKDSPLKKDKTNSPVVQESPRHSVYQGPTSVMRSVSTLSPTIGQSRTSGPSPTLGPSPVQSGSMSEQSSPILINPGPHSGSTSAPGTPGTPGSHPGSQSPVTPVVGQMLPVGSSIGTVRMPMNNTMGLSTMSPQGRSVVHLHHPSQGYGSGPLPRMVCHTGGSHLVRQQAGHPPPPPPYPGHPPSYSRPQVLAGDGLMIRAPLGGVPSVVRPQPLSPVLGNAPILMGGPHRMPHISHMGSQVHRRPLLLQEQRLLIEDIIEEEKREQMKQQKAVAVQQHHQHQSLSEGGLVGGTNIIRPTYQRLASHANVGQLYPNAGPSQSVPRPPVRPAGDPGLHPALLQAGSRPNASTNPTSLAIKTYPPPPQPPDNPQTEADFQIQQQYETWLNQQNNLIMTQQKYFDTEIAKLRRQRKSLNSRQRTLKKNGQELNETDAAELDRIQKEATAIQRQLETCRKSSKQHAMLINDYNAKKKQRQIQMMQSQSPTGMIRGSQQGLIPGASPIGPTVSSPMHSTPQSPLMSHSPSSQHSMVMSPMIPSPHTPVASPNTIAVPQHSPHSMVVPVPHPSPVDHVGGPFSPQARMPSPSGATNYGGPQQMVHPMLGHQGMRVRMPTLSPGNQGGQITSHMMVIRPNYSPGPVMNPQQGGQQMVLKHQYSPNVMPLRRPSGSGPVPSPSSCHSPIGLAPSPVSSVAIKPSSVHSGLKSPVPLSSPQMQHHSMESPGTPLTPRSNEMMGNPLTPHSDHGGFTSQVSSPHHSILTHTPPSPYIGNSIMSNSASASVNDGNGINSGNNEIASAVEGSITSSDNRFNVGGGGGGGGLGPIPLPDCFPSSRYGHFKFGLRGGGKTIKSRWGYFKLGLRGGQPTPIDESSVNVSTTELVSCTSGTSTTTNSSIIPNISNESQAILHEPFSSGIVTTATKQNLSEEGLAGMLNDCIKNSRLSSICSTGVSQPTYTSSLSATAASVYSLAYSKVIVPEPPKSDIPPSSRHQAVIGIPGGGAIPSQSSMYPTPSIDVGPGVRIPLVVTSSINYSIPNSYPSVDSSSSEIELNKALFAEGGSSSISHISSNTNTSSLIPAPIMSINTTSSSLVTNVTRQPLISLAKDANTLATVVSASNQVSLALSLGTTKSDVNLITANPISSILSTTNSSNNLNVSNQELNSVKYVSSLISRSVGGTLLASSSNSVLPQSFQRIGSASIDNSASVSVGNVLPLSEGTLPVTIVTQPLGVDLGTQPLNTSSATVTTRTHAHTLHHLPQQRLPVVLASTNPNNSGLQVVTQQGQIVSSNLNGQSTRIFGATIPQQQSNIVVQNQLGGHLAPTHQMVQLPSLSHLNAGQLTRAQVVQSLGQYGHVVQSAPNGQLIVQHQQPTGMVLASSGSHVRMVGQQVTMMQPGSVIRGSSVMVKSSSQVQGGVKMMMIHNSGQRTPTPPPGSSRQSPMMPPPAAKSPALHSASPIPRVSPAPSPIAQSPSPHSPQVKSHSPHLNSPVPSPSGNLSLVSNRKDSDDEKILIQRNLDSDQSSSHLSSFNVVRTAKTDSDGNIKEMQIPSAPNALLKQLLQNAGCSSSGVSPGQLVLVRSSPAGISTTHLSQVATQIPNPSSINISKSLSDSGSTIHTHHISQSVVGQSGAAQNSSINQIGRSSILPQQTAVIASNIQASQNQPLSSVQLVSQPIGSHLPNTVVSNQTTPGNGIYTTQISQGQHIQTIIPSTHYIRQAGIGQNIAVQSSVGRGALGSQTTSVSIPGQYVINQTNPNLTINQGKSPQSVPICTSASSIQNSTLNQNVQSFQRNSPVLFHNTSLAERIDSNPSVKTEMRVVIPDSLGSCSGPSTGGDHTPELNTPNDSYDDPEEAKKAKKRQQNQARRKSQTKDTKVQPAKRSRQGSRVEEDYDAYIEGMMSQLRAMPPLTILEPEVPRNFNVCPMYGCGDLSKLGRKEYNHQQGLLEGSEGFAKIKAINDYYNTQPFGPIKPMVTPAKKGPTQRGFYNQEFTPPKIGLPLDDYSSEIEISCLNKSGSLLSSRESDSPDTVLSSSSPECVMPESPPPFKGLRLVDMEDDPLEDHRDRSISPAVPLLVPIPLKGFAFSSLEDKKFEIKDNKENFPNYYSSISVKNKVGLTPALPLKDMGNVTVSLTLSSQAGQDVSHVLRSLANLLNIPPPLSYDIADFSWDNNAKVRQLYKHIGGKEGKEQSVEMQSILNGAVKFCKQCNSLIILNILTKKLSEMPFLPKEEWEGVDDLSFCAKNCFIQFALSYRVIIDEKTLSPCGHVDGLGRVRTVEGGFPTNKKDGGAALDDIWNKDESFKEVLKLPQFDDDRRGVKHKYEEEEEEVEEYPKQADGKRFKGHQYKYWTKDSHSLPDKYEKPTNKEMTDLLFGMRITYRMPRLPEDSRQCSLCPLYGDYVSDGPSRLLNYDVDKWVHLNCALWAEDVYETMSGSLMNVELALKKAANLVCDHCEQAGASIKCFKVRCSKAYHLNCAVKEGCTFYKNKTVYCQEHINKGDKENELSTLAVFRRVYVERDENRQIASVMHHTEMNHLLRIGSLILLNIGQLLPHQLQAFHSPVCIYPIGYHVIRFYWSMRQLHKRCAYECSIHEVDGQPDFRILIREEGHEDLTLSSRSPKGVWNKILEPITELRQNGDVVKLFSQFISGEDLFGLTEPAIVRILESMPGVDTLADYTFKYGSNSLFELPLAVNPTGCARAEPFNKSHMKRHHGMRTTAGSVKTGGNLRTAATIATFTMNFDPFAKHSHSRFFQYKKMRNEWRSVVYLARSKIQGLGLYAARDIERNTAIIEYIGEIIRGEVAEVREKRYEASNRGIYMFRLDENRVVDATVTGGLARYINHSCGPNCYTETVEVEKDFKIIIVSNRKILRGEELAYDYKFDEEEDHKIPCLCGAENCRKWMN